jgi:hypothetical protein
MCGCADRNARTRLNVFGPAGADNAENKCSVRFSPHPRQLGFANAGDITPVYQTLKHETQNMKLNEQDRAALRPLADFVISDDGESAVAAGEMAVVITRAADDTLRLLVKFPGGEELDIQLSRGRLLQKLSIETSDS